RLAAACAAFMHERNRSGSGVNWRFTTVDARIKLKRLYPTIEVW
ncbi:MAG TPA: IS630 family transposase, partial [Tepidisphaeraceae bacterium]|nr:IS630 family transposase [Tepidisphaeraceae bacterium]HEV2295713.1 IS630 family transposase [Tepidisphaeraceae bacterium]